MLSSCHVSGWHRVMAVVGLRGLRPAGAAEHGLPVEGPRGLMSPPAASAQPGGHWGPPMLRKAKLLSKAGFSLQGVGS